MGGCAATVEECRGHVEVQAEVQVAQLRFEFSKAVATQSARLATELATSRSHDEAGAQAWNK